MKYATDIKIRRSTDRRTWVWFWVSEVEGDCVGADVALTLGSALRQAHRAQRREVRRMVRRETRS